MPIELSDKIVALLTALRPEDIEALPPAERRRFAANCRRAAEIADPPAATAQNGVLAALADRLNPRHGG